MRQSFVVDYGDAPEALSHESNADGTLRVVVESLNTGTGS